MTDIPAIHPEIQVSRSIVHPLHYSVFEQAGVQVSIRRDDLIHPVISGNKWRKLNLQLADAINNHKTTLVTFGGAYSNHLVATACAGKLFGINTVAFIRGEEERQANHYDLLCQLYGMKQIRVNREAYRNKQALFNQYFGHDDTACFIDEGGAGELGARGCEAIIDDIEKPDYICLATGTATTMRGIADAVNKKQWHTKTLGFSVMKGNHSLDTLFSDTDSSKWQIFHDYHRGGYGRIDHDLMAFIKDFTQQTTVLADPVYVGKMLMGVCDLVQQGYFKRGSDILCIHTGGNLGLFSPEAIAKL